MEDLEEPLLPAELSTDDDVVPSTTTEEEDTPSTRTSSYYKATLVLLLVSFLFATLNVSLRSLYGMPHALSPAQVNVARGWCTVLFFLPFLLVSAPPSRENDAPNTISSRSLYKAAGELALWNFGGQVLVNVGLLTTPSARASFLGQTVVAFVPLLSAVGGAKLSLRSGVGCLSSMMGVVLLSFAKSTENPALQLQTGDLWVLASAFCFSCYLIRITQLAPHHDEILLQGTKNTLMALLYSLWWIIDRQGHNSPGHWSWWSLLLIAYTALGPGALADVLQQKAQKVVAATESNLILCTSSVFTAVLARLLLGEETTGWEKVGGAFLIVGAAVAGSAAT